MKKKANSSTHSVTVHLDDVPHEARKASLKYRAIQSLRHWWPQSVVVIKRYEP
ncbi:hypothetical protein [Paenibacillus polymyxa]|uniref:hypothetical protein n=1 Tax=Paenibacillus polymyxa TaxID=1406 RepID=UPI0025B71D45|nr:hypothetical protein [Paenibacillus polymyxa]MDN4090757.1 hypothetical protein [Paenibacillus polymyxa]